MESCQTVIIVGETGCGKTTQIPQVSRWSMNKLLFQQRWGYNCRGLISDAFITRALFIHHCDFFQYLLEAGWAAEGKVIGVTQPRRVAAVSVSPRPTRSFLRSLLETWLLQTCSISLWLIGCQPCSRGAGRPAGAWGGLHHQIWWLLWSTSYTD